MGGRLDGHSLMEMEGAGCSAGRFSFHSAMVSFTGEPLLSLQEKLWQGLEGRRCRGQS